MAAPEVRKPPGGTADADHNQTRTDILQQDAEACRARVAAADKAIATLRAKFAMRGYELHVISDGFYITRWGMGRTAHTMADLEAFAAQVGAL